MCCRTAQQSWDEVAGEAVKLNGSDVTFAKLHLGAEDVAHERT